MRTPPPSPTSQPASTADDDTSLVPDILVGRASVGESCYISVTVEGVPCLALVDSGATVSLVRPDVVPGGTQLEPTAKWLRTVTGELAPLTGKSRFSVTIGGWAVRHLLWIAAVQEPCILGLDFLKATGCVLDFGRGLVSFRGGPVVTMLPIDTPVTPPVRLFTPAGESIGAALNITPAASLPPATPTRGVGPSFTSTPPSGVTPPLSPSPPLLTEASQLQPRGTVEAGVTSTPSGTTSTVHATTSRSLSTHTEREGEISAVRDIWRKNCGGLDPQQQEELWQLLLEFKDSFAMSDEEVGVTHLVHHDIDTGDARPIKCRPRRLPLARQEACDEAVRNLLQAGIIEPSDSPWAAAVVMVPKKVSGWRLCLDYRPVNGVTQKDSYPLPRIDESLDLVSGSSWFSSLDLRSGYYQVPLSPEARPKTAFCTGRGLWQFKVLSFGLCNAPATFARLMDRVLAGVPRQQCLVYLDDILAHGSSFETALGALRQVLERIRTAGLKLHPEKCHFMQREVTFLGHKVGEEGIGTLGNKVQAVTDWPAPTNQKQLKSFLGLASYYRRFVRGFSCTAAPLFQLLQKDCDFLWTEQCQEAFTSLQRALSEAPVLAPADPSLPFLLDTDASGSGVGGVLSQTGPDGERVVAYFSRAFNKAERRYCVTRRELLAVVLSIRHFKYYLCGPLFRVRTDHAALQWLMTFKEPEGQVARWIEELQAFYFTVEHRPGARHTNADALSRRPCAAVGCLYCERRETRERELREENGGCAAVRRVEELICRELQMVDPAEWRQQQEQDPDLKPVLQWVEAQQQPPWEEVARFSAITKGLWAKFRALRLCQGVLQRAWSQPATGEQRWQVVVPHGLQEAVLEAMHGAAGSGHFGVTKTLRRLRQSFYWGQCRRDVEDFCRRCDACTARKGPPGRSHAPLQQHTVGAPMERVAVDVVGPLPRSDKGNRYVLSAIDYFTKWPEAYAIPDQEAVTVADALVEGMFSRFGVPETIHSDQGRNFESRVFASMCERLGMHKTRTTPLHPQSDGLVERFHRTLGQQLAIITSQHQRDWDDHLPLVLMACRSAMQETTSCTPSLLMLGRELRTPAELSFGRPPDSPEAPPGPEYARRLQDRLDLAHAFARKQQQQAGLRQKRNYDVRTRGRHFQAGELVWVYSPQRKKGRCPKLESQWVGPCKVLERWGEVVYRVQLPGRGRRVALHRDRLAPYRGGSQGQAEGTPASSIQPPTSHPNGDASISRPGTPGPPPPSPPELTLGPPSGPDPAEPPPSPSQSPPHGGSNSAPGPGAPAQEGGRPRRQRRPPGRYRDFEDTLWEEE